MPVEVVEIELVDDGEEEVELRLKEDMRYDYNHFLRSRASFFGGG